MKKIGLFILLLGLMSCNNVAKKMPVEVETTLEVIYKQENGRKQYIFILFYDDNAVRFKTEELGYLDDGCDSKIVSVPKEAKYYNVQYRTYAIYDNKYESLRNIRQSQEFIIINSGENILDMNDKYLRTITIKQN